MLQPMRDHIELQDTDGPKNDVVSIQRSKHLCRPFFTQLIQSLVKCLGTKWISQSDPAEKIRREVWNTGKFKRLALGKSISYSDGSVVVQANNIPGTSGINRFTARCEKRNRIVNQRRSFGSDLVHAHSLAVTARGNP